MIFSKGHKSARFSVPIAAKCGQYVGNGPSKINYEWSCEPVTCENWVELRGIEPLTSSMRTKRATNCATAP